MKRECEVPIYWCIEDGLNACQRLVVGMDKPDSRKRLKLSIRQTALLYAAETISY